MFNALFSVPFFLGLIASQYFELYGGKLYLGELLAMLYFFSKGTFLNNSTIEKNLVRFGFFWLTAQILSDIINSTELSSAVKGELAPVFLVISILGLITYFRNNPQNKTALLLGIAIGAVIRTYFYMDDYFAENIWKGGFGNACLSVFLVYFSFFNKKKSGLLFWLAVSSFFVIGMLNDSRSFSFMLLASCTFYYCAKQGYCNWLSLIHSKRVGKLPFYSAFVLVFLLINVFSTALFSSETFLSLLPADSVAKYQNQVTGEYGMILGGRTEILASFDAFIEKPILGHGSWAIDLENKYIRKMIAEAWERGYVDELKYSYEHEYIPAHSYLMGSLVWSGIAGGLFWLFIINKLLRILLDHFKYMPVYYYCGALYLLWDILFSPFGYSGRWQAEFFLAAFISHYLYLQKAVKPQ